MQLANYIFAICSLVSELVCLGFHFFFMFRLILCIFVSFGSFFWFQYHRLIILRRIENYDTKRGQIDVTMTKQYNTMLNCSYLNMKMKMNTTESNYMLSNLFRTIFINKLIFVICFSFGSKFKLLKKQIFFFFCSQ